jgi:hypothetical protein
VNKSTKKVIEAAHGIVQAHANVIRQRFMPSVRWSDIVTMECELHDGRMLYVCIGEIAGVTIDLPDADGQLGEATVHLTNGNDYKLKEEYSSFVRRLVERRAGIIQSIIESMKGPSNESERPVQ